MSARNSAKGREAENAVAAVFQANGMPHAERRAKRGGYTVVACDCLGVVPDCHRCQGTAQARVHRDAGDLAGIPGVVVQVKWSGYAPLAKDLQATELQRQAAGADVGLLVRKRPGVGCARAGEWDAYLPSWQVAALMASATSGEWPEQDPPDPTACWRTDLLTAVRLLARAGYGTPTA